MAKIGNAQAIRKTRAELDATSLRVSEASLKLKCDCVHVGKDKHPLLRRKDGSNDNSMRLCTECRKDVRVKQISDDDFMAAIDLIDSAIDCAKITIAANSNDPADTDRLERLAKFQFKLNDMIPRYWRATKKMGKRSQNKNNRNDKYYGSRTHI